MRTQPSRLKMKVTLCIFFSLFFKAGAFCSKSNVRDFICIYIHLRIFCPKPNTVLSYIRAIMFCISLGNILNQRNRKEFGRSFYIHPLIKHIKSNLRWWMLDAVLDSLCEVVNLISTEKGFICENIFDRSYYKMCIHYTIPVLPSKYLSRLFVLEFVAPIS